MEKLIKLLKIFVRGWASYLFISIDKRTIFYSHKPDSLHIYPPVMLIIIVSIFIGLYYFFRTNALSKSDIMRISTEGVFIAILAYSFHRDLTNTPNMLAIFYIILIGFTIYSVFEMFKKN